MKKNLEIEYKCLLDKEEYLLLLENLAPLESFEQVNTYYDTSDYQLFQNHHMARIRTTQHGYEFTLKIPQKVGVLELSALSDSSDINQDSFQSILREQGYHHVTRSITVTKTFRSITRDEYAEICLDHTIFEDGSEDYEIEYELFDENSKAMDAFQQLLDTYKIVYKKAPAKFARAMHLLKRKISPTV